ncbi:PAS domain S-box protein [Myxococcota bacterium]|nr:PAS domain S-box protein [Myxococcota bacterium]
MDAPVDRNEADPSTPGQGDEVRAARSTDAAPRLPAPLPEESLQYLDVVGALIIELDRTGKVVRANRAALELVGRTEQELTGQDWFDTCVPAEVRDETRTIFHRLLSGHGQQFEYWENPVLTRERDEHIVTWRTVPRRDASGEIVGTLSAGIDVSHTRFAQRALNRSLKELEDIKFALDMSTIVAITDPNGAITYVNDKFCQISKYSREELIGQTHRIINSGYHPREFFKEMWATIKRGNVWQGDIRNRARDGQFYWVATTIVPFLDDRGRPYQYLAIRHEITERKNAEAALEKAFHELAEMTERERRRADDLDRAHRDLVEANRRILEEQAKLIQAEKLSSIGLLAAGVAHEINNPLSGVLGCVKALREQTMTGPRRDEYFETVLDGLERIQNTVRGLLDYARQRAPAPEPVDPGEILLASLRLVTPATKKKDLRVVTELDHGATLVRADRAQVMQGVVNVLLNAAYAAPVRSELRVETVHEPNRVGIRIADRGPGIPKEIMSRVCDPFFTTKPEGEGTGLGLAVTLSIVRANGGDLAIESTPGLGTTVTIWLPIERSNRLHA